MASRNDLQQWVVEALHELGGSGHQIDVAKILWRRHEPDLRESGDLFYTWQYDMRWAATRLRKAGILEENASGRPWRLCTSDEHSRPWSPRENQLAVECYVRMYRRMERGEQTLRGKELKSLARELGRSEASISMRLSNISTVVEKHGVAPLRGFKALPNVGSRVRGQTERHLREEGLIS